MLLRASSLITLLGLVLLSSACGHLGGGGDRGPAQAMDLSDTPDAIPRHEPRSKYGNPPSYEVLGRTYTVMPSSKGYREQGIASWYGQKFHGRKTSSGEIYNMYAMTAAHKSLPLPTYVRVTNLDNRRSVIVKVNDRGPFHEQRLIDLSYAAASKLGIAENGTGRVEVLALEPGKAPPPAAGTVQAAGATAVAPPAASPTLPEGKQLYIQVGAFISRTNAERMSRELARDTLPPVRIHTSQISDRPLYRVRIGPITSVEEADRLAQGFIRQGVGNPQIVTD